MIYNCALRRIVHEWLNLFTCRASNRCFFLALHNISKAFPSVLLVLSKHVAGIKFRQNTTKLISVNMDYQVFNWTFLFTQCLKSFLFLPNGGLNGTFHSRNMKLKHVFGSSVLEFVWLTCWSWYVLTWSLMFILCVTCDTFGLFCKWALASVVLIDGVSAAVDNTLRSRHQGPNFPLIVVQQNHILLLQKVITLHALFGF